MLEEEGTRPRPTPTTHDEVQARDPVQQWLQLPSVEVLLEDAVDEPFDVYVVQLAVDASS